MAQSVTDSTMTDEQLEEIINAQDDPAALRAALKFLKENPAVLVKLGFVDVKYYKALKHILKEQRNLTDESMESLMYALRV